MLTFIASLITILITNTFITCVPVTICTPDYLTLYYEHLYAVRHNKNITYLQDSIDVEGK